MNLQSIRNTLIQKKASGEKLTMLTAYDYTFASILADTPLDMILIGDSIGNVILGHETTDEVTLEHISQATKAVKTANPKALIVSDLPLQGKGNSTQELLTNATQLINAGADMIKVEVFSEADLAPLNQLKDASIPVVAHLGLTPQFLDKIGGYKVQGRDQASAEKLQKLAEACEAYEAVAIVLELIPSKLAQTLSESVSIPTIGIGAGPYCDGQVLVLHDLLGFSPGKKRKFVKEYLSGRELVEKAVSQFVDDVKTTTFPTQENAFE